MSDPVLEKLLRKKAEDERKLESLEERMRKEISARLKDENFKQKLSRDMHRGYTGEEGGIQNPGIFNVQEGFGGFLDGDE